LYRHSKVLCSIAVLPLVGLGAFANAASDGGAEPGFQDRTLALSLSSKLVTWGSPVTASGRAPSLKPGALVRIVLRPDKGLPRNVASTRLSRNRTWKVILRPTQEGEVFAVASHSLVRSAAVSGAQRIDLAIGVIPVSDTIGGRAGTRIRLAASVKPAQRVRWTLETRSSRGWRKSAAGLSRPDGRIEVAVRLGRTAGSHRIRVEANSGLAGNTSRPVRSRPLRPALASWYGLYGGGLACGGRLGRNQMGVAHKRLPCGTKVTIRYRGRTVVVPVIDRGPFVGAREFDLTGAVARRLHFDGVDTVWVSP